MQIIGQNEYNCDVEIMPIDGHPDHYYIMTEDGAPFAKIMPPKEPS